MAEDRKAAIAGAGIGGLAAGLALARRGWQVTLYERMQALTEVGAGLQMSPNACHVLRALGVLPAVRAEAAVPEAAGIRDGRTGAPLFRLALGASAEGRYGAPYLCVHRADLHAVLLASAKAAGVRLVAGRTVSGWQTDEERAALLFEGEDAAQADLLVGADGVRSVLGAPMHGDRAPRYMGHAAWRAIVPAEALPKGLLPNEAVSWAGKGGHLVTYPLRKRRLINLVAIVEREEWTAEDWRQEGDPDEMRAAFEGWHPSLGQLLEAVRETKFWGLFARPPLRRWQEGRAALLGDAAHPMLPFMAQGAAMALEDAFVLAASLEGRGVEEGLALYEKKRATRAAMVQRLSRANAERFHGGLSGRVQLAIGRLIPALPRAVAGRVYSADVTR